MDSTSPRMQESFLQNKLDIQKNDQKVLEDDVTSSFNMLVGGND